MKIGCFVRSSVRALALLFAATVSLRSMASVAIVADSVDRQAGADSFERVASFYGLPAKWVDPSLAPINVRDLSFDDGSPARVIYIHERSLERLGEGEIEAVLRLVTEGSWLYVDASLRLASRALADLPGLARLTDGRVRGARGFTSSIASWTVRDGLDGFGGPFRGRTVRGVPDGQWDTGLIVGAGPGGVAANILIEADDFSGERMPTMAHCPLGRGGVVVDSGYHWRRVGTPPDGIPLRFLYVPRYFSSLVPEMLFLRFVFGDSVWHSDEILANLTVDDPGLVARYGFLDLFRLLDEMRREGFHTTIATIPAKYLAAQPSAAALVRDNPRYYSIAVHGNNHDAAECLDEQSADDWEADFLEGLSRLDWLRAELDVPIDRVMVFPCGMPSAATLPFVNRFNLIATVNAQDAPARSGAPTDWDYGMHGVEWALAGAPSARRSPIRADSDPAALAIQAAFDAFVGKPILFYAHHELFRSGPGAVNDHVRGIRSFLPDVEWASLRSVLLRSFVWKRESSGEVSVLMVGNAILLRNAGTEPARYRIVKPESGSTPVRAAVAGGRTIPFAVGADGRLRLEVLLQPHEEAVVEVLHGRGTADLRLRRPRTSGPGDGEVAVPVCNVGGESAPAIVAASRRAPRPSSGIRSVLSDAVQVPAGTCASVHLGLPAGFAWSGPVRLNVDPYDEVPELSESNNRWDFTRRWVP